MREKNKFGEFIAKLRTEKGISQSELCSGLCTKSMLSRFERGEREPEKLMQNRFLTRLGVAPENYENFLYYNDYCRWEKRQGILHHILEEKIDIAKNLLESYRQEYDMEYVLEKQFYLAMLAQIERYEGADETYLAELFGNALTLTVSDFKDGRFFEKVLSLEEINLLLEYIHCSESALEEYEELLAYIDKMERDLLGMAKIYPKTVYYYYLAWEKHGKKERESVHRMFELCDKAIELLRDANRLFYMWELLGMKERLLWTLKKMGFKEEDHEVRLQECRTWKETLEVIYKEAGVTIEMYEFCYLYVESQNYCIGDVIRIRRKMLGLSQEKLSENICDPRRVSQLERNLSKPQKEVVQLLFERLNLSTELNRTEVVTENPEAVKKYMELQLRNNNLDFLKASGESDIIRAELKELISLDIPSNVQIMLRNEIMSRYNRGELTKENYVFYMKQALGCTVPYSAVVAIGDKYLTNEEIGCLQNLTLKIDWSFPEMEECVRTLIEMCERPKYHGNYLRMYQFIMSAVSSHLGNKGDYEQSNVIKRRIIELLLRNRKGGGMHEAIYGILWNNEQKAYNISESRLDTEERRVELLKCIQTSKLFKDERREKAYTEKVDMLSKKISESISTRK